MDHISAPGGGGGGTLKTWGQIIINGHLLRDVFAEFYVVV